MCPTGENRNGFHIWQGNGLCCFAKQEGGHKARPYREIFGIGGSAGPFFAAFVKIVEKL